MASLDHGSIIEIKRIAHQYAREKYEESTKNTGYLEIFR